MPELVTRRGPFRCDWLLGAIQREGQPVATDDAVRLLADSPWPTTGRNTARKTLRVLARAGRLTAATNINGRRLYHPTSTPTGTP